MVGPKLSILTVASSFVPVSRDASGGSEQITYRLDRALVENGHRSVVVGCRGSSITGELVPVDPILEERGAIPPATWRRHRRTIADTLARSRFDLVHIHSVDFFQLLPPPGIPTLVSLHMPPHWYPDQALRPERGNTFLQGVSRTQHRGFDPALGLLEPIANGVPVDELTARHARRGFALNIGRICPEKGVHLAIEAARIGSMPLVVAGDVFPFAAHLRYMDEQVVPRLDDLRRHVGALGFARKRRFMTAARCVLIPVTEPETSCLVAMEALACGTPVIAFPMGAIPEIIRDGETGFLVEDIAGMAAAMNRVDAIDPAACRQFARDHLTVERMADRYIERYRALAAGAARPAQRAGRAP